MGFVAMWLSGQRCQSGNPEVVGSNPADGEKYAVGQTFFQDRVIRGFYL